MTYSKFKWLTDDARKFLHRGYIDADKSAEVRAREITDRAQELLISMGLKNHENFSNDLYKMVENGWVSFSSPVWSNFGKRGLPISCFGSVMPDSVEGMATTGAETIMMTKMGGGTSCYLGEVREMGSPISTGGLADGPAHYAKHLDSIVDIFKQADTRRGACAVYLDVDHTDIESFLQIKHEGNPIQNLQYGVNISDEWMESMIEGDMKKRSIWAKILTSKANIGFPYLHFSGNSNNNAPAIYSKYGRTIKGSNLCNEIYLHSSELESFVCCLSSINLLYFDDWKDTNLVEMMLKFLDAVMEEFIQKASDIKYMERAVKFARNERALGLGVLGWSSYLQSNMIPIESIQARLLNKKVFKTIRESAEVYRVNQLRDLGPGELDPSVRNTTLLTIPPSKSTSFIMGVSSNIEVDKSNYYIKDLAKIKTSYVNPFLLKLLRDKGFDTEDVWDSILNKDGSVQHLDFLTKEEKDVFKTSMEISQGELVVQNADRQKYIDQGISFNLSIHPSIPIKEVNKLYIEAWRLGIKGVYYQYSKNSAQAFATELNNCVACDG